MREKNLVLQVYLFVNILKVLNPAEIRKSYTQFNSNMLPNCTTGSLGCHNQSSNHLDKASWLSIVSFCHALFMWSYLLCLYYFKHGLVDIIVYVVWRG